MCYEINGNPGGCKAAKMPHLMMGDFNATPCTLESVKEIIEDDLWEDLGQRADW